MESPFRRVGLGYAVTPPDAGVNLIVDYLEVKGFHYFGELTAQTDAGQHLGRDRVCLTRTTDKTSFATKIAHAYTRYKNGHKPVDWTNLVELFSTYVVNQERIGQGVVDVSMIPEEVAEPDHIQDFIPWHKITWLYGPGGTGKGHIAALAAVCVCGGHTFLGRGVRVTPVLYLDWEDDYSVLNQRVEAIAAGLDIDKPHIMYKQMAGPLANNMHAIAQIVAKYEIEFIVVDSMRYAAGASSDKPSLDTDRMVEAVKYINKTTLVIDHVSKEAMSTSGESMPIGDIGKVNAARRTWEIRKDQDDDPGVATVALYNRKSNYGQLSNPLGIRIEFQDQTSDGRVGRLSFKKVDVTDSETLAAGAPLAVRLEAVLRHGARTVPELAAQTGAEDNYIRVHLNRYRNKRYVQVEGTKWGLATR